jgi:O-antigen/teichoic acid export membrane protein
MDNIDYKKLRTASFFLVSGQLFQAFLAFGVNLILVRHITPSEFGRFALILAGAFLIYSIISSRINFLIARMPEADYNIEIKQKLFSAMTLETIVATLFIMLWLIASNKAGLWECLLVGAVGLRQWTDLNKAFFERDMPYRQLAIVETGASTGGHLIALSLVLSGMGWMVLFIREILISFINLFGLWRVGGLTIYRLRFLTFKEWLSIYKDARGVWLDGVLEGNFQRLTILLAGFFGNEFAAGLFFQAQRLAFVPHQLLSPIVSRILAVWFGRTEDNVLRDSGRDRVLRILFLPLLLAGILTVLFADPVVPWLFGQSWFRVADLLIYMSGMIIFCTLFETLKSYCLATRATATMFGSRVTQYIGLLVPTAFGSFGWLSADIALALGLSVAYFFGFIFIFIVIIINKNKSSNL